jgi:hypothetical protein
MKGLMVAQQSQRLFLFGIVCSTTSVKCTMMLHKFSVSVDVFTVDRVLKPPSESHLALPANQFQ